MKSKKLWLKLLLDLVMLIVLTLLLWKDSFGMEFHEIAGVGILGAFFLHIILNWRWVFQVTKRFFHRGITVRTRIGWLLNAGLLVCFALIGISGILMSRVLFHFSVEGNWKTLHYFCSALALILVGIHLGLQLTMIGNALQMRLHLRPIFSRIMAVCLAAAIVVMGVYSISDTSFTRWLAMPFQTAAFAGERPDAEEGRPEHSRDEERPAVFDTSSEDVLPERGTEPPERTAPEGQKERPSRTQQDRNAGVILWKSLQYASICGLFALLAWSIDRLLRRRHQR